MSDLLNAVDQIKAWAKKQEAVARLAAELERIGSIEQAEHEATRRLSEMNLKVDAVKAEFVRVSKELSGVVERVGRHEEAANKIIADARAREEEIIDVAKARAGEIVSSAEKESVKVKASASEILKASEEKAEANKAAAKEWADRAAASMAEHSSYVKQLNDAKARAKEVLSSI